MKIWPKWARVAFSRFRRSIFGLESVCSWRKDHLLAVIVQIAQGDKSAALATSPLLPGT